MPDLTEALRQKEALENAAAQKELAGSRADSQRLTAQQFGRYDRLLSHEDFQWWLGEVAARALKSEHDGALDTKGKSESERSDHAHRHAALKSLLDNLTSEHTRLRAQLEQISKVP